MIGSCLVTIGCFWFAWYTLLTISIPLSPNVNAGPLFLQYTGPYP